MRGERFATPVRSLSRRAFGTIFAVAFLALAAFTVAGIVLMQNRLAAITREGLLDEARIVAGSLDGAPNRVELLRGLSLGGKRVTLIEADGTVLFDSEENAAGLDNHAGRPEVAEAFARGEGSSERSSATLGEVMLYEAIQLGDGSVVRLSQSQEGYLSILLKLAAPLGALAVLVLAVSLVAARRESRAIIAPLLSVDLDHPKRTSGRAYAEMAPMIERIENQRRELKRQMRVLADSDRMRREFTANITHELKTPLTTISGYAELIGEDMVSDPADVRDFGSRIHREAGRLTSLVNDILTLSNLDEAEHSGQQSAQTVLGSAEPVDLARMLASIARRLEPLAARSGVTIALDTANATVLGVPRLLDGLAYNLASNAIRYNRFGGSVTLACGADEEGAAFIRVADTGIGIDPAEQDKVFERFYRVDKSRSKARGGTGLGLAIVKHAAAFHGARIELDSAVGQGTRVTVSFPAQADEPPR